MSTTTLNQRNACPQTGLIQYPDKVAVNIALALMNGYHRGVNDGTRRRIQAQQGGRHQAKKCKACNQYHITKIT